MFAPSLTQKAKAAALRVIRRACGSVAVIAGLGLCLWSLPPVASAGGTIVGGGNNACESYLDSDDDAKLASESWVLGFLSSANMRSRNLDLLSNLSNGTIIDALESHCTANPGDSIAAAAIALLKSLVASADGECSNDAAASMKAGTLSICHTAGSLESNPEPTGFNLTVPGVE